MSRSSLLVWTLQAKGAPEALLWRQLCLPAVLLAVWLVPECSHLHGEPHKPCRKPGPIRTCPAVRDHTVNDRLLLGLWGPFGPPLQDQWHQNHVYESGGSVRFSLVSAWDSCEEPERGLLALRSKTFLNTGHWIREVWKSRPENQRYFSTNRMAYARPEWKKNTMRNKSQRDGGQFMGQLGCCSPSVAAHHTKFVSCLHLLSGQVTHITAWLFWMFKVAQGASCHMFQRDTR